MSWHYEPPAPETEGEVTLSSYHLRLRAAEARDLLEVNAETEPSAGSRFKMDHIWNAVKGAFTKVVRARRKSDRDPTP